MLAGTFVVNLERGKKSELQTGDSTQMCFVQFRREMWSLHGVRELILWLLKLHVSCVTVHSAAVSRLALGVLSQAPNPRQ